ncbi:MAG: hypothetical protein ACK4RK_04590 [Gemmataceae bacterium]
MGFFSGRVSCVRFRVEGPAPGLFGPEQLDRLAAFAIGQQRVASADGVQVGWSAGDHILDTTFTLEKNIIHDALHFALRVDTQKVPGDLWRAYTHIELEAAAAENPSGRPSMRQKREARAAARERLEQEAADGRFLQRKLYPVLWDGQAHELLFGSLSVGALDRMRPLFQKTFGMGLELLSAGRQAFLQAEARQQTRGVDDAAPSAFVQGSALAELAWLPDDRQRDFLGNEFLLWLWYALDDESDTIPLADGSEVTGMMTRTLVLECPRGQTGRESIHSDAPGRLPEARRAIQTGKLPRKAGLTLVRHDQPYELTLQGESLAISSAKLPPVEGADDRARLEERMTQIRQLLETLDLLYDAFGQRRLSDNWPKELAKMQHWLRQTGGSYRRAGNE